MGPIVLFDKSFLQMLSVDESVWFSHFFMPVVCPLFYLETLADLQKMPSDGTTVEEQVRRMGAKFPDMNGTPCALHTHMLLGDMLGHPVPMDGRIPVAGGRTVRRGEQLGVVQPVSDEAQAFARWSRGQFSEVERGIAKQWRAELANLDLKKSAEVIRSLGVSSATCKTLDDAYRLADSLTKSKDKPHQRIDLVLSVFPVAPPYARQVMERHNIAGYPPLETFAPYAAHVIRVWLFFHFAMGAGLISTDRPSHQIDIAYLYYAPFCHFFVSTDKLHRTTSRFFLRKDQEFVWGKDLKDDLTQINKHFLAFPEEVREKGLGAFAHAPPDLEGSIVCNLRKKVLGEGYDRRPPVPVPQGEANKKLFDELTSWSDAQTVPDMPNIEKTEMFSLHRAVKMKRGSWYQVAKGTPSGKA